MRRLTKDAISCGESTRFCNADERTADNPGRRTLSPGVAFSFKINPKTAAVPPGRTLPCAHARRPPAGAAHRAAGRRGRALWYCARRFWGCGWRSNICTRGGRCRTCRCRCWPCSRMRGAGSCPSPRRAGTRPAAPAGGGRFSGRARCRTAGGRLFQRKSPIQGGACRRSQPGAAPAPQFPFPRAAQSPDRSGGPACFGRGRQS